MTADAMHTQEAHVTAMNALRIGWMLILKDNQPGLYAAADAHRWENEPVLHGGSETGHGRHEVRTIKVTSEIPAAITAKLPGAAQLMLIERYRHRLPHGGAPAACRDGDPGDHDPLACAAACGAKLQAETVLAVTALTPAQAGPRSCSPATATTGASRTAFTEQARHYDVPRPCGRDAGMGQGPAGPGGSG